MSGPAIHHIVAKEYINNVLRAKYNDPLSMSFWNKMDTGDFAPVYNLGAQGPDFLFFNMADWPLGGVLKPLAQVYWEVEEFMEEFKEKLKSLIPDEVWALISTLETLADDAVERSALLSEISELLTDVQNNIEALKDLVEKKIQEYITDSFDFFNMLKHPQQHGQEYSDWWWFDSLHIRRTGRFLREMLIRSSENSMERAFALGYLTHFSTDTVGHPFVNAISGGPYRTHSQRHKVVENHQDVWAYKNYTGGEFVKSNLAGQYLINGDEKELPDSLKKFIISCINKVYYDGTKPLYGKEIKAEDLDISYRLWLKWFTRTTNSLDLPEPKPYSLTEEIIETWEKFVDNVGDIGDMVGGGLSGGGGILGFLKALAALIAGGILLGAALIDFIAGEIATIGTSSIRYFLSLTYEALYNSFMNFRHGLVMNGFEFPTVSGLDFYMTKHMINTKSYDLCSHNARSLPNAHAYPSNKFKMSWMEGESHLIYPWPTASNLEKDPCTGFPSPYYDKTPEWYMTNPDNNFRIESYNYFKEFVESSTPNPSVSGITGRFTELSKMALRDGLGNALKLGEYLYSEFHEKGKDVDYAEFNLDSDRGYAFKCWRKVYDTSLINDPVNNYSKTNVSIETDKKVPYIHTDIIYPAGGVL